MLGVDHDQIILLSTPFPTIPMLGKNCCYNVIVVFVGNRRCCCIASTTIKLISKTILLSILSILLKTIQRIGTDPKRKPSPPFDPADSVPSLGHPTPGSGKMLSLLTALCDHPVWMTETRAPGSVKQFSQS